MKITLFALLLLGPAAFCADGPPARVACYNVESLHDTVADPLLQDAGFTPHGVRRWDSRRYRTKIEHIARVVDELQADLLALEEIENEQVLRDLLTACASDYCYIHRNTSDRRGMDVALLYRGSRFFPERVRQLGGPGLAREALAVDGTLDGEPVTLLAVHLPSQLNKGSYRLAALRRLRTAADSTLRRNPRRTLLILGDMNCPPEDPVVLRELGLREPDDTVRKGAQNGRPPLYTPFLRLSRRGYGSYVYRDRRYLYDWIALGEASGAGTGLRYNGRCGIFVRDYLMHTSGARKGYPVRTFRGRFYDGGYSDHLPVWAEFEKQEPE